MSILGRRARDQPRFASFSYNGSTVFVKYRDRELMQKVMEQNAQSNIDEPSSQNAFNDRPEIDMFLREPPEDLSRGVVGSEGVNEPAEMPIFVNDSTLPAITWPGEPWDIEWTDEENAPAPAGRQGLAGGAPDPGGGLRHHEKPSRWPDVKPEETVMMPRPRSKRNARVGEGARGKWW